MSKWKRCYRGPDPFPQYFAPSPQYFAPSDVRASKWKRCYRGPDPFPQYRYTRIQACSVALTDTHRRQWPLACRVEGITAIRWRFDDFLRRFAPRLQCELFQVCSRHTTCRSQPLIKRPLFGGRAIGRTIRQHREFSCGSLGWRSLKEKNNQRREQPKG